MEFFEFQRLVEPIWKSGTLAKEGDVELLRAPKDSLTALLKLSLEASSRDPQAELFFARRVETGIAGILEPCRSWAFKEINRLAEAGLADAIYIQARRHFFNNGLHDGVFSYDKAYAYDGALSYDKALTKGQEMIRGQKTKNVLIMLEQCAKQHNHAASHALLARCYDTGINPKAAQHAREARRLGDGNGAWLVGAWWYARRNGLGEVKEKENENENVKEGWEAMQDAARRGVSAAQFFVGLRCILQGYIPSKRDLNPIRDFNKNLEKDFNKNFEKIVKQVQQEMEKDNHVATRVRYGLEMLKMAAAQSHVESLLFLDVWCRLDERRLA